jgi:NitT/TauT family transport system ATP-binding protein
MTSPLRDVDNTARSTPPPAVRLRQVRKVFDGDVVAIDDVSLSIPSGQFFALLGPSGSGKSTLLRIIAGLDTPTSGAIERGDDVRSSRTAFVFQDPNLLPWRSVLRNVELPLELSGVPRKERRRRAVSAIEQVGLSDAAERYPAQLSGGMKMRASLARALVTEPDLLLLDEPFAALDEITRQSLDDALRALWKLRGLTVLFVTHSIDEATYLAERAVMLSRRPARVVLDHRFDLPTERDASIRTTTAFATQARVLFDALSGEERAP